MEPIQDNIRERFPLLARTLRAYPLTYLDNGATTQKPEEVICAVDRYYRYQNANVHRGVHTLSQQATDAMEAAREKVRGFLHAPSAREIIFTRGTTESINLVAAGYGHLLQPGDEILVSQMEHHSNIVPWQLACAASGAHLRVIPVTEQGLLDEAAYRSLLTPRTRIVAIAHVSNVLGTVNPIAELTALAHRAGAVVVVDGAQAVPHLPVDVQALGCDFYAFSGHKMYAPTGIGALWGRESLLEKLPVYQGGGEMIGRVTFEKTTYADLPFRFEAGTPNIEGAIGLGAAIDFMDSLGREQIHQREKQLMAYLHEKMSRIESLTIYGNAPEKSGAFSFNLRGAHPSDVGTLLDSQGVAVRTGHHCAEPLMDRYGIPGTVRASLAVYNTFQDIDRLFEATQKAREMLLG